MQDLAREPVVLVGVEEARRTPARAPGRPGVLKIEHADLGLVEAQMQDGVVELAREPQRPELGALRDAWPSTTAGGAASGPWTVTVVTRRASRSISTFTLE